MSIQTNAHNEFTRPTQEILSVEVDKLYAHPANPNRLSEARFRKLLRQIERTRQYEPLVVRRHPTKRGGYQVLNGHHRLRALKQLGQPRADCVVFRADDTQALVYLATLNRICGRDNAVRKARLMSALCRRHTSRELARALPESPQAIEKLAAFAKGQMIADARQKPMLVPMTFFVSETDHALLCEAFDKAAGPNAPGTRTEKRLRALKRITAEFLGRS